MAKGSSRTFLGCGLGQYESRLIGIVFSAATGYEMAKVCL